MKRKVITLFLSMCICSAYCQTVTSFCVAPDSVVNIYKDDVDRMCLRRTYHVNSTWKDSVFVDTTLKSRYLKALLAVYNATMLPARDTAVRRCNIHVSQNPDTKTIYIAGDSNLVWLKNIRYNVSPCGNSVIDNAIPKYGLQKISFNAPNYWIYHTVVYKKINGNLNMGKLGSIFSAIPYANSAPNATAIDGTEILDSLGLNYTMLSYSYGWGDCWEGCIYRRFWIFKVYDNNCTVEYIGSYGDAVLPDVGIKENTLFEETKLFPNPTNNKLNIEFTQSIIIDELSIYNPLGEKVFEMQKPKAQEEIDLSFLANGIFYLKVKNDNGQKVFKVLKE